MIGNLRNVFRASGTALLVLALGGTASAQGLVPEVLPYQGLLSDAVGAPVNGQVDLTFRLYSQALGAVPAWTEQHLGVDVVDGVFSVYLGEDVPLVGNFRDGSTKYLGISVGIDVEASPRQNVGSVPYALLAGNALSLGGAAAATFVTNNALQAFIDQQDFVSGDEVNIVVNNVVNEVVEAAVNEAVIERAGLSREDLNAILAAASYVTHNELTDILENYVTFDDLAAAIAVALAAALEDYVTADDLAAAIAAALAAALEDYVTADDLAAAIAAALAVALDIYITEDELNLILQGFVSVAEFNALEVVVNAQAVQLNALNVQIVNLQNVVNNLQNVVNQVANNVGGAAFILGVSAATTDGRIRHAATGRNGIAGATAMCRATFANEATAHLCTADEVNRALSTTQYTANGNFNNVDTWSVGPALDTASFGNSTYRNSCQNLMYNSGDAARGTKLRVTLNRASDGGGGGLTGDAFDIQRDVACATAFPVLCCR
ncbi:MAG: hypothetical protein EXR76_04680 [Myxococcales bacterium]|nr:hypothetical protein [Myxococcales bacterium]